MKLELPKLPFAESALEPHISERTVQFHYHKHHAGYVKKTRDALDPEVAKLPLEEIIRAAEGSLFNNSAQVWNHNFYWESLAPERSRPDATLKSLIDASFGSMDKLKQTFASAAAGEFGSGWTWLVFNPDQDRLNVFSTSDAVTPVVMSVEPLLTLDVWEHAYYLDYQNDRGAYINAFLEHLANWEQASKRLEIVRPGQRKAS